MASNALTENERERIITALEKVKILDPACGSGAFPIGALQKIVFILQQADPEGQLWFKKQIKGTSPEIRKVLEREFAHKNFDYIRKLGIIRENIYGVDIQPIATEISRLRCFLTLVVEERIQEGLENRGIEPLPNLDFKFVTANTLIGLPGSQVNSQIGLFEDDAGIRELKDLRDMYFNASGAERDELKLQFVQAQNRMFQRLISEHRRGHAELTTKLTTWDPFSHKSSSWFDPEWMFGIKNGFDVVIANPPYIRIQALKELAPLEVEYYKKAYKAAGKGNYDIYVVFVEKGLALLNKHGRLSFILPHKFFNAQYGEALRALIARHHYLSEVVHFGDKQVFEQATTYTCLMFLDKEGVTHCRVVKVDDLVAWRNTGEAVEGLVPAKSITQDEWNFVIGGGTDLFERLSKMPVKLENITNRIFQGLKTSADKIYIVEERIREANRVKVFSREKDAEYWLEPNLLHPLIKGGDSRRYSLTRTNRLILFPYIKKVNSITALLPETSLQADYPLTWAYLKDNKKYLEDREDGKMRGASWYSYGRNQALDVMPLPKIFTPDIAAHASFSLDATGDIFFTGGVAGGYGILVSPEYSREYILGLVNSKLLEWFIRQTATQMRGGYYSFESRFIRNLPIRTINFSDPTDKTRHDKIVELVERMLSLHKRLSDARMPHDKTTLQQQINITDQQIDRLVYEQYGLTEEEIKIVEEQINVRVATKPILEGTPPTELTEQLTIS